MENEFARQLFDDLDLAEVQQVLAVFEADMARLLMALRNAAEQKQPGKFRRAAREIAEAAAVVGAVALATKASLAAACHDVTEPDMSRISCEITDLVAHALRLSRAAGQRLP